jgi:uncharacterized damage-inducible protein DinB
MRFGRREDPCWWTFGAAIGRPLLIQVRQHAYRHPLERIVTPAPGACCVGSSSQARRLAWQYSGCVNGPTNVAPYYVGWQLANESLIGAIEYLTPEQLELPVGSPSWPIWASVSHVAGARVYWLCHVFGEPGMDTTPFRALDIASGGWEDDLGHPRRADELVAALTSSWDIAARCLMTWTPESLGQTARRPWGDKVQIHTRQSVLWRLITHDAFHSGEISLALGSRGLGAIEMWSKLSRLVD